MPKSYPIPCTKEEVDALIKEAEDNDFYYTLFMVARTTGRRLGEYYNVKVEDIKFDKNVMETEVKKRRAYVKKEALLREDIAVLLRQFISRRKLKEGDYVFREVKYRAIQHAVTSYASKANIPHKVSFHNFRHYFITELVRKGWHYDEIAKLTGHTSPSTILNYDHALIEDIRAKADEAIQNI